MSEIEEKDDGGSSKGDGRSIGESSSESRFSFLNRKSASGSVDSGSNSDGSGSGKGGTSGSESGGNSERSGQIASGDSQEPATGTRANFGTSSSIGDDGRGGIGGDGIGGAGEKRHLRFTRKCSSCLAAGTACGKTETGTETGRETRKRSIPSAIPEQVDFGEIFPGLNEGKPVKVDSLFALAHSTVFDLIGLMRKEDHWKLSNEEANKLGKVSVACMNTMPETKAKIIKKFEKQLPWISLIGFGMVITYPRILASVELEKQKKTNRFPAPVPFSGKDAPAETLRSVPVGSERETTDPASGGSESSSRSNFPPGHSKNFPEFDYKIPS